LIRLIRWCRDMDLCRVSVIELLATRPRTPELLS
jgi:hypothetical protein